MTQKKSAPKKTGRPSKYSAKLVDTICARIAQGESLNKICKTPGMPTMVSVWSWLNAHDEFLTKYTRAREIQADTLADQITDIADESAGADASGVQAARLRVDARKWIAAKLKPKKYGDRVDMSVTGDMMLRTASDEDIERKIKEAAEQIKRLEGKAAV